VPTYLRRIGVYAKAMAGWEMVIGEKGRTSFLKKRSKKLLILWG
jgi:hypothetical protein